MRKIFDFGNIEKNENAIKSTWLDFKNSLINKDFAYDDVENAKQAVFLRAKPLSSFRI